ncbi:MAG: GNAT family N-acetyltransferase [Deltaproteobacteria bacterium]|nr:GNAT family N-acetyltransferase [bacterium]MCB9487935.1 GNAT family N-acetyltransferase [Deltaproteobacteria bacterium]
MQLVHVQLVNLKLVHLKFEELTDEVRGAWWSIIDRYPGTHLSHTPDWVDACRQSGRRIESFGLRDEDGWLGFLNIQVGRDAMQFTVADRPWMSFRMTNAEIAYPRWPVPNDRGVYQLILTQIMEAVPELDGIRFDALPEDDPLWEFLDKDPSDSGGIVHSPKQVSRRHQVLTGHAPIKRPQNFRKKEKRVERDLGPVRVEACRKAEDVPRFIEAAKAIFEKSWQFKDLGPSLWLCELAMLTALATTDHLACYLLFAGDQAVAFDLGFVFNGLYYRMETAFDSKFAYYSPGMIGLYYYLDEAFADPREVKIYDFGHGHYDYKAKLSHQVVRERFATVYRKRLKFAILVRMHALWVGLYDGMKDLLTSRGWDEKIRRLVKGKPGIPAKA